MNLVEKFFSLRRPDGREATEKLQASVVHDMGRPTMIIKIISVISIVILPLFSFFLPTWSYYANDVMSASYLYGKDMLCDRPADEIACHGLGPPEQQRNYTALVQELDEKHGDLLAHRRVDGVLYGCGCEQGWLSDWVCPRSRIFSISYFIATAPGTGMMAAATTWGIMVTWAYGGGTVGFWRGMCMGCEQTPPEVVAKESWGLFIATVTQFVFQFFYGLFLMAPVCIAPRAHNIVVYIFIIALIIHLLVLAIVTIVNTHGSMTQEGKLIIGMGIVGMVPVIITILVGSTSPLWPGDFGLSAFYYGEAWAISIGFNVAPVVILTRPRDSQ